MNCFCSVLTTTACVCDVKTVAKFSNQMRILRAVDGTPRCRKSNEYKKTVKKSVQKKASEREREREDDASCGS